MVNKTQMRAISIVLAVILLLAAFMTGITGVTGSKAPVNEAKAEYKSFKTQLDTIADNEEYLADNKEEYDAQKAEYDTLKAEYDEKYAQYEESEKKYTEDIMSYNQQLIAYNVGKNQFNSSGAQSAIASGKSELESGWAAYNQGKAAYDQLNAAISELENKFVPHWLALKIVGGKAGINLTDSYIADMKNQLDTAYAQLQQGEAQLDSAQQQVNSASAQLSSMQNEIAEGPAKLDADGQAIEETKAALEKEKETLDAKAEELSVYEKAGEKVERGRDDLIDEGYGTEENTTAELLSAALKHEGKLRGAYLKASISFTLTYACHLLAVVAGVAALVLLAKKREALSLKIAIVGAILGAVSVISSLIFGSVDTLAFAAAVFTLAGVALSQGENSSQAA